MKKFNEEPNVAVITTRFVFNENQPVLFAFHHEDDGFWEFIGDSEANEEDYMLVSLAEMIEHDRSILNLADLPLGKSAKRKDQYSEWQIE
jgi:hypothetical protein